MDVSGRQMKATACGLGEKSVNNLWPKQQGQRLRCIAAPSLIWVACLWQLGKTEIYRRFPYENDPQKIFRRLVRRKIHHLLHR